MLTYAEGYRNGHLDRSLVIRSRYAESPEHGAYALGYRDGVLGLPKRFEYSKIEALLKAVEGALRWSQGAVEDGDCPSCMIVSGEHQPGCEFYELIKAYSNIPRALQPTGKE